MIKTSFSKNGVSVSNIFCQELYSYFSKADAYSLYPDVLPCLQRLSATNVAMGMISDFDERLEGILQGLGVASYFQFVVQSFVEGYSKPSKELWRAALQKAGGADEKWHIGDDPEKDAFVNATTIILDRTHEIRTDFRKISSLDELPEILSNR